MCSLRNQTLTNWKLKALRSTCWMLTDKQHMQQCSGQQGSTAVRRLSNKKKNAGEGEYAQVFEEVLCRVANVC